jgi:hypothetical protein
MSIGLLTRTTRPAAGAADALKLALRRCAWAPAILVAWSICGAEAAELPLARVVLLNSGLAQFTHAGTVSGASSVVRAGRREKGD